MPAAVPLLVGIAAQGAAVHFGLVAAGTLGFALVGAAGAIAGSAIAPKPRPLGDLDRLASSIGAGRTQQIRQPITAHQYIYGTVKTSGPIVFAHTREDTIAGGRDDGFLYLVIVLAAHKVSAIGDVYLGEDLNTADRFRMRVNTFNDFTVPAAPHVVTFNITRDGLPLEILLLTQVFDTTANAALDAVPAPPGAGQYSRDGNLFTFSAAEEGHVVRLSYETYFRDERVSKHLGTADQTADSAFIADIPDVWTADHRLRGRAYLAIRFTHHADAFPSGVPNVSAVVDGLDTIYDPRSGDTGWSDNPALCIANWMTSSYGLGLAWSDLDEASVIAASNVCDELVAIAAGGTVKRYTCNGSFNADVAKRDVLQQMLSSMAGVVVHMGGKWFIHAGAPATPTVTLDEDDLRGPLVMAPKRSMRDRFNGVRAVYVNPNANWQPVDAPPLLNDGYVAEDQDEELYKDLRFPFTTSTPIVQRLMKIELERNRRQRTIQFPAKLTAMRLAPWDGVYLDLERYGFEQAQFRVVAWALSEDGGIDLTLQADDADVYSWSASEEVTPAVQPTVTLPNPAVIAATESITVTTPTTPTYSRIDVSWDAVASIWLAGYDAEFRASGATDWTSYGQVTSPSMGVARNAATDFRARARTGIGVTSDWVTSEAPAMPSGVSAIGDSGEIDLAWTNGAGAAEVQIFVSASDDLSTATLLATVTGTSHTHSGLGAGATRYYWLRSNASGGNFSNETASVNATTT